MVDRYDCPPMDDQKPIPNGCMVYASDYDALAARIQHARSLFYALKRGGYITNPALTDEVNLWLALDPKEPP